MLIEWKKTTSYEDNFTSIEGLNIKLSFLQSNVTKYACTLINWLGYLNQMKCWAWDEVLCTVNIPHTIENKL